MKSISVYDVEADKIEKICLDKDTTSAELIEALMTAVEDGDINIDDYI